MTCTTEQGGNDVVDEPSGQRKRSRRTRARIVDAATRLFVERGYLTTTVEDIALASGVAVQTVYYVFGTKRSVLQAVLDATIVGDLAAVPMLERPWVQRIRDAPDAKEAMRLLVDETVGILARTAPVYEVVRGTAADPEVGELLHSNRRARRSDQRRLIEILADNGHVQPELDIDTAADVFYALMNEEVLRFLVVDCQWDLDRVRTWAVALLSEHLVR